MKMKVIKITTEYITLGQFLKLTNIISSGSEAKYFLSSNKVLVNNQADERRGRKLYSKDIIKIKENEYMVSSE